MILLPSRREAIFTARNERNICVDEILTTLITKNKKLVHVITGIISDENDSGRYIKLINSLPSLFLIVKDKEEQNLLLGILHAQKNVNDTMADVREYILSQKKVKSEQIE